MAEQFSKKIVDLTYNGFVSMALAVSKDVGILSTLAEVDQPLSSFDIARQNKLKERYVRELLGSLVCAEIIQVSQTDAGQNVYSMTTEQKQGLAMGFASPCISMVTTVAEIFGRVKECVHQDGPYGFNYEESAQNTLEEFSSVVTDFKIAAVFEVMPDLQESLESGIDVIEYGCGLGSVVAGLAQKFPNSRFTASELTPEHLANLKSRWSHIPNLSFSMDDLCQLNQDGEPPKRYDWVFCFNAIHDLPWPQKALDGIRTVLKSPGGRLTFVDACPTEHGTHQEGVGSLLISSCYAWSVFMCMRESIKDDSGVALGPCGGRTVIRAMAEKAGLKAEYKALKDMYTMFYCTVP